MFCKWPIDKGKFSFIFPWNANGKWYRWFYYRWCGISTDGSKAYIGIRICGFYKIDYIWLISEPEALKLENEQTSSLIDYLLKEINEMPPARQILSRH